MLKELVKKNRSYRNYDRSVAVTDEMLLDFIDTARLSPASMNMQPLKYYPVTDDSECKIILSNIKYAASLPTYNFPYEGKEAPAYILICHDLNVHSNPDTFLKDVGIVAQTITLAAAEADLGCCMVGNYNKDKLRKDLNLPDNFIIQLVISIGAPGETVKLVEANEDESVVYYRDEDDNHYPPKRKLEHVVIKK